jgi:ribosomal protein S13
MNNQQTSQPLQFDIFKDFELREVIEKSKQYETDTKTLKQLESNDIEKMDDMIRTLPFMNDNIRSNIKLGIEIYKKIKNFDRNYIHSIINENSTK